MQLIFTNTLEKQVEEDRVIRARVSIGETQGVWQVTWAQEGDSEQHIWFEGFSWDEMLTAFRYGVAVKMGEGFVPLVDGLLEERSLFGRNAGKVSYLHCFGELHANPELFEELKTWRRRKASDQRKAAYLVSTNRMLRMISAFVPQNETELLQIPGWGESKHSVYADEVLKLTRSFEQPAAFPLDWVQSALNPDVYTQWLYKQKEQKFKEELNRHQQRRKILEAAAEGFTLSELEQELGIGRRELIERIEQLQADGYDLEALIDRELTEVSSEEFQRIWDTLSLVGDRYLKPVLAQVYDEEQLKSNQVDQLYDRLRLIRIRYRNKQTNNQAI
ncbi:HRDC domain-containing protein [Paenibacillus sp. GCM10012307]|uniref:HRDC domain-containing protein n=1 Tax=Paenibacillus roseus TaxID=2798579 RepID=A0A934JBM4_9BACL|nr:HRDC domain-containing protein [Paenibacillus roseus]MBJ6363838.1 HRDC domain-containing protein [Paenibacillus roseus]